LLLDLGGRFLRRQTEEMLARKFGVFDIERA
jgi:hypothetical protein